ncbi:MAG: (Fe-S)-binding protein [Desulfobulbia bacterium]
MLLTSFTVEFSPAGCCRNKGPSLRCLALLDQNVSEALPYLNAVLGGYTYIKEPPSLAFHYSRGILVTVDADSIAINCTKNPTEAEEILAWLQREINAAWEKREEITPKYTAAPWPTPADILRLLPKTDCGQCGLATCIAFASTAAEGGKVAKDCPVLPSNAQKELTAYLSRFHFDRQ